MKPQVCNHCWKKFIGDENKITIIHEYLERHENNKLAPELNADTLVFHVKCWKEIAGEDYIPKPKPKSKNWFKPEKYIYDYNIDLKFDYNYYDKYSLDEKSFYDAIAIPKEYFDPSDKK